LPTFLIDFILHVDKHLEAFVQTYGAWVYALLFLIIFVETGLVVMPFLPGDSLLFVVGALCGAGLMDIRLAMGLLVVAAASWAIRSTTASGGISGTRCSSGRTRAGSIGAPSTRRTSSTRPTAASPSSWRASCPSSAPFAPFVAGVAEMTRSKFTAYNVVGALIWVVGLTAAGYWFGNLPWVQANLSKIIWAMILIPGVVVLFGAWKARRKAAAA
jgi:membrane-associated protein